MVKILVGMGGLCFFPIGLLDGVDVVAVLFGNAQDGVGIFLGRAVGILFEPVCVNKERRRRPKYY